MGRGHTATEEVGQATASALVEQHGQGEDDAENAQDDRQRHDRPGNKWDGHHRVKGNPLSANTHTQHIMAAEQPSPSD